MDADLEQKIVALALLVEAVHRLAHAERRRDRTVGHRKCGHHRVANGLHDRAGLGADDLRQDAKMPAHEIIGNQITDTVVELGRAFEVGEQEGKAGDLEPLLRIERVGAVQVAENLVGE